MKRLCLLLLVLCMASGCATFRRWKGGLEIRVDSRYRAGVEQTLREVETALGMRFRGYELRVGATPGTHRVGGRWTVAYPWEGAWHGYLVAGWASATRNVGGAMIVVDPASGNMDYGLRSPLAHELAHAVMDNNRIPRAEHHGRMQAAGILVTGSW